MLKANPDYFVEIKQSSFMWFWSIIRKDTCYAIGKKYYIHKDSAKRAFENLFGVKLVTKHFYGKGSYRQTYNIKKRGDKNT